MSFRLAKYLPLCWLGLALWSCQSESTQVPPPPSSCGGLDSLIQNIEHFTGTMSGETPATSEVEALLLPIMQGLRHNMAQEDSCNYLDDHHYPDHVRFDFVEQLTRWSIRDTIPDGIRQLIKLRGIFIEDQAIAEFFSEEIARIALQNPLCYQRYFDAHPSQQQLLLNSTEWSTTDLNTLIDNFKRVAPQPKISAFLEKMQFQSLSF